MIADGAAHLGGNRPCKPIEGEWTMRDWSLRTKVLVAAALAIVAGFGAMIAVIAANVYQDAVTVGYQRAGEQADAYARQVEDSFRLGYAVPKQLAAAVQGM